MFQLFKICYHIFSVWLTINFYDHLDFSSKSLHRYFQPPLDIIEAVTDFSFKGEVDLFSKGALKVSESRTSADTLCFASVHNTQKKKMKFSKDAHTTIFSHMFTT